MSYFAINSYVLDGSYLPAIAHNGAKFSLEDIDSASTGRNESGTMMRDRVATKIKWQLKFPPMTEAVYTRLLNAVQPSTFTFTCPNPLSPNETTDIECYAGPKSATVYSIINGEILVDGVSFNIIEL